MKGNATFLISSWNETPFSEIEGAGKLSRASVSKSYTGDIAGEGVLEYLMTYTPNGSAEFFGLERVRGKIGNRSGSFVIEHKGKFENGEMTQTSQILADSGTDELEGIRGSCTLTAGHQQAYPFEFRYEFEK